MARIDIMDLRGTIVGYIEKSGSTSFIFLPAGHQVGVIEGERFTLPNYGSVSPELGAVLGYDGNTRAVGTELLRYGTGPKTGSLSSSLF